MGGGPGHQFRRHRRDVSGAAVRQTGMRTEIILGNWLAKPGNQQKVVVASKIAGPGRRAGSCNRATALTKANIIDACEGSLRRLQTDFIDLYQIHWPDRNVAAFGTWRLTAARSGPLCRSSSRSRPCRR